MKGQSKRFVDHKGEAFKMGFWKRKVFEDRSISFPELWRYASPPERLITMLAILLAWLCSCCLVAAILIYGELTSLFVERTKGNSDVDRAALLTYFGGGKTATAAKNDSIHMMLLVDDSIAFGCASVAIMLVQLSSAALAIVMANWTATRMVTRLRWKLLRATLRQELAFFDTNKTFSFANAVTEDMEKIRLGTGSHVVMFSYLCGSVVAAAALALAYGWKLTLAGLSVVPIGLTSAAILAKYQTKYSAAEAAAYGVAGRGVQEALAGVRTVKAYGGEEVEVERYANLLKPAGAAMRKRGLMSGAGAGTGWLLTYALNAIVLAYGAKLVTDDMHLPADQQEYHPGILVTILFCTFMAAQNITMCNPHLEIFSGARGAARAIYRLLERKSSIDSLSEDGEKPEAFKGDISFENIYFNYPARPDVKVLRGFNLRVPSGATVALVGSSGCGKSTTLQLLQRLYEPGSGRVMVDGRPLTDLNIHHFRSHIGVVGQEPVLFSGTIRENITRGMSDVTEDQIVDAARIAHAHDFIRKLADGYDTYLGSGGAQLSGGQKQRIAIARAIIRHPAILLLDEPTSALDPPSEKKVQAALDNASVGRTTLVVSHRLSTVVNATAIVYMEQGAVLEQGTYSELLEKQGLFWKLVQDDMSTKPSVQQLTKAEQEERNATRDIVEGDHFEREFRGASLRSIHSTSNGKQQARGSHRMGNVAAAHIPNVAAPDILSVVDEETESLPTADSKQKEDFPLVSTWRLLKLNAPEWRLLTIGGGASFLIGAAMPMFALLFSKLYGMFASEDKQLILQQATLYASLFMCVAGMCGLVTFLQGWLLNLAGSRLTNRLRVQTFSSFLRQEQGWLDLPANSVGALCARLASDCAAVQGATGTRLGTVLQGVSTMAIGVTLAMVYSWKMTLVSLLSVPCVMGGIYLEGYIMKKTEVREKRALELASRVATEAVINIRTVQSLSIETPLLAKYQAALDDAHQQGRSGRLIRGPVYGLCLCAPTLGYAVSLAYGGYLIAREGMPYEYAILVSEALIYGAWMLAEALSFAPNFAAARRSGARIIHLMNRKPAIMTEATAVDDPNWTAQGDITYKNIEFRYPTRRNVPVLQGLDLHVARGTTVALVGASGCGKSTLMQILMRLYDADSGTVQLDGVDARRSLTLPRLRRQLGLVQQEPVLFDRSVRDNIAYGDTARQVTDEEVVRAAEQANVHSFIASLPLGYDTSLGAGGAQLSGGQKQRIAIARALVRNPRVLLLDEATSALDANSEKTVQAALEAASVGRTTVMIAHRLATVRHAHMICVIVNGKVAETGSHEELIKLGGHYLQLLNEQGASA